MHKKAAMRLNPNSVAAAAALLLAVATNVATPCAAYTLIPPTRSAFTQTARTRPRLGPVMMSSSVDQDERARNVAAPVRASATSRSSLTSRALRLGSLIAERMDTMRAAGLYAEEDGRTPMHAITFKQGFKVFLLCMVFKWYRTKFITKTNFTDRQPQWGMVITKPEQEKQLHAYTCRTCGSTIFVAKGRDWIFNGDRGLKGLGCYSCGAKGEENFYDAREEILEEIGDDDYFDYEKPLDFLTRAERRKVMKEAGGDEARANEILIERQEAEEGDGDDVEMEEEKGGEVAVAVQEQPPAPVVEPEEEEEEEEEEAPAVVAEAETVKEAPSPLIAEVEPVVANEEEPVKVSKTEVAIPKPKRAKKAAPVKPPKARPLEVETPSDDLDVFDMDAF